MSLRRRPRWLARPSRARRSACRLGVRADRVSGGELVHALGIEDVRPSVRAADEGEAGASRPTRLDVPAEVVAELGRLNATEGRELPFDHRGSLG